MNALLADPARVGIADLLRDGRIGLYVVAMLAGRHGIRVADVLARVGSLAPDIS